MAWPPKGTVTTTRSDAATASSLVLPSTRCVGNELLEIELRPPRRGPASRDPIVTGIPALAQRAERPNPSSPVAPTTVTCSMATR